MAPHFRHHLHTNIQGTLWMILAGSAFAASNVAVRLAAQEMHPFVVVFLRSIIAIAFLGHIFLGRDFNWWPGPRFRLHLLRGVLQATALLLLYTAITITPIATVIAIAFITPLISGAGAIMLMGEPSRLNRWFAVAAGFAGMLVIVRPGIAAVTLGMVLVLAYAVQQAASNMAAKVLIRSETATSVVAWMTLLSTPLTLVPALFVWSWPSLTGWGLVAFVGVSSTIAHIATTQAYRVTDITVADPMIFFRLIAGAILGYAFFAEVPDLWTLIGGIIIIGAIALLSRDTVWPATKAQ